MRRLALVIIALPLLTAAPAAATDYCVSPATGCTPANTFATVQEALNAALPAGYDTVTLGPVEYAVPTAGLNYTGDRIDIRGGGATLRQGSSPDYRSALFVGP